MIAPLGKTAAPEFRPGMGSTDIEGLLDTARADVEQKVAALDAAQRAYADAPSVTLKHGETEAQVALDIAQKQVERLERELVAARDREEQAERQSAYDAAVPLVDEARRLHGAYREHAAAIAKIASRLLAIDEIVHGANGRLPKGADPLMEPSAMRGYKRSPLTVKVTYSGWVDANGVPLHRDTPTYAQTPKDSPPPQPGAMWGSWETEAPYLYAEMDRYRPSPNEPFDTLLNLPALEIGGTPFWRARK